MTNMGTTDNTHVDGTEKEKVTNINIRDNQQQCKTKQGKKFIKNKSKMELSGKVQKIYLHKHLPTSQKKFSISESYQQ